MKKIICTLKLIRMLWSANFVREILLFLELTFIAIIMIAVLLPINNAVVLSSGIEDVLPRQNELIYCSEYDGANKGLDINKIKSELTEKYGEMPRVYMTESNMVSVLGANNESNNINTTYLLLVSKDLFSDLNIRLSKGKFKKSESDVLPVILSSNMSDNYKIGDRIFCSSRGISTFVDGTFVERSDLDVECEITGILDENSTIIDIAAFPSRIDSASLNTIGWNLKTYSNINFIIATESEFLPIIKKSAVAFAFDNKINNLHEDIEELNAKNSNNYGFSEYTLLKKNLYRETFEHLSWRMIVMVLLILVIFFNYIGYLIINIRQRQHTVSIISLCGLSFRKLLLINIASVLLIVVPALAIGLWVSPFTVTFFTHESFYGYNSLIYISVTVLFVASTFLGIIAAHLRRKSSDIISFYKKA